MKKTIALLIMALMILSTLSTSVSASTPLLIPDVFDLYVMQGQVAKLKFKWFPEFKNEKYHINVYKGETTDKNKLVASFEDTVYNAGDYFLTKPLTVDWDTKNVECGIYTVEFYMSFYTFYEWHDPARKDSPMTITVFKPGEIANTVLNTDIKASIDGYPIRSYNIDGYTCIVAEDLQQYGFDVVYSESERSLKIEDANKAITAAYEYESNMQPIGSKAMDVYYTDIITKYKDSKYDFYLNTKSYNVDGMTLIKIDVLDEYGDVLWIPDARTISFVRRKNA